MLEQEKTHLSAAIKENYPAVARIIMPLLDRWEFVHRIDNGVSFLYVASLPVAKFVAEPDEYYDLPPAINLQLHYLKLYSLFQPNIAGNDTDSLSHPLKQHNGFDVQIVLQGEAKAWFGKNLGIIQHCRVHKNSDLDNNVAYMFWRSVEYDIHVNKIFTPTIGVFWDNNYTQFLSRLGYVMEPKYDGWWSKVFDIPFV
jgi:hypothetical protein